MAVFQEARAKATTGLNKARKIGDLFGEGFRKNAGSDFDIGLSTASGLWQGLKYKGSIKKGIAAGATTYLSLRCVSGFQNVINHWQEVKWTT